MAKRIRFCTRCMNIVHKNDEKCSSCGLSVKQMQEEAEKQEQAKLQKEQEELFEEKEANASQEANSEVVAKASAEQAQEEAESVETQSEAQTQDKAEDFEEVDELTQDNMDMSRVGTITFESEPSKPKRHKHKKKVRKEDNPKYTVDEEGNYNIDTKDVTYLEGVEKPTSSIKKARGDVKQEKIEWWDIYKWADRMLARRKIMKEVNKASRKRPEGISRTAMILWCIFFGWLGIHNFYARNYKKGWTVVIFDVIIAPVVFIPALYELIGISIGGGLGFVVLAMWLFDIFGVITSRYKYRISKEEFISNLNVSTRAKLGKKYIDLDRATFKAKEKARLEKLNKKKEKKAKKNKSNN